MPEATRVLIATSTGSHWAMSSFESVLAAALRLRGALVEVLLCDGVLPACQECDVRLFPDDLLLKDGTKAICGTCFAPAEKMFSELDIVIRRYGTFLDVKTRKNLDKLIHDIADKDIFQFKWRDVAIGEHAIAGTLRFFGRGTIQGEPFGFDVARRYLRAAMYTAAAIDQLLLQHKYDVVVFHHGIYVPQGVIGDVCRLHGVRVVNWNPAYRQRSFIFSHGDSYHKTMIEEPREVCFGFEWTEAKNVTLMNYLDLRRTGSNDWITFQKSVSIENPLLLSVVENERPKIGLLTNVMWDAQLHFKDNAFQSMLEWLHFTIDHFANRTDIDLLVRIHPAEVLGTVPSRQPVLDEIFTRWPSLPKHIHIIPPDDESNTYKLMTACDAVLVYGTKMSIELSCLGIPVIVAGEAWARGKGFTTDVSSIEDYQRTLSSLPARSRLSESKVELAKKYAYHLFFRRMIQIKFANKSKHLVPFVFRVNSLDDLAIGSDPGLDTICNGIVSASPFLVD